MIKPLFVLSFLAVSFNSFADALEDIIDLARDRKDEFCQKGTLFTTSIRSYSGVLCEGKDNASVAMWVCGELKSFRGSQCHGETEKAEILTIGTAKAHLRSIKNLNYPKLCGLISHVLPSVKEDCDAILMGQNVKRPANIDSPSFAIAKNGKDLFFYYNDKTGVAKRKIKAIDLDRREISFPNGEYYKVYSNPDLELFFEGNKDILDISLLFRDKDGPSTYRTLEDAVLGRNGIGLHKFEKNGKLKNN